jgi:glycosyltransferase involved in cell wall biosynthesis
LPLHEQFRPLQEAGVQLASLGMAKGVPDPRAMGKLARLLRRWRPDVVHAHMVHANLLARLARTMAPVPRLVSTMHNQDEGSQWRYYAYRLTDRLSDVTTNVSQVALDEALRRHAVPRDKMRLVPNGIDADNYVSDAEVRRKARTSLGLQDEFTWLTAGRLTDAKRHTDLLAATRVVLESGARIRVLIAGTGPLFAVLEEEIVSTGLSSNVSLLGLREDVPALMQAADGFVMSSAWEGLPMVMLEASASSLPIVATDVGGSHDIVEEGVSGFLTPALHPQATAEAMLQLMRLAPDERKKMGDSGRQRIVEHFDMTTIADEWEGLYRGE